MNRLTSVVSAIGVVWLCACTTGTGPDRVRELGLVIEGTPPMTSLIAPGTVQRGVPFAVTASTFGSSSCTEPDGYHLDAGATRAEIRLYDLRDPGQTVCTDDLHSFPRQLLLQFNHPGIANVVVIGRDGAGKSRQIIQTITVLP